MANQGADGGQMSIDDDATSSAAIVQTILGDLWYCMYVTSLDVSDYGLRSGKCCSIWVRDAIWAVRFMG